MYDFHFGTKEQALANEEDFLIFVKRLLPRWCNSIPDSQFLALNALASGVARDSDEPVFVESGCGASTVALVFQALRHGGTVFTWDTNGSKGSFLRGVLAEALEPIFDRPLSVHWRFIGFSSISPHLGIPILSELGKQVDLCCFDGEHTLDVLANEVTYVSDVLREGGTVVIDDANLAWRSVNFPFVNIFRRKLGLPAIDPPGEAEGPTFAEGVEATLRSRWATVDSIAHSYSTAFRDDLYFAYFRGDRAALRSVGMEKGDDVGGRMKVWRVAGRK